MSSGGCSSRHIGHNNKSIIGGGEAARAAGGPNVQLFYNDYSAEGMSAKSNQMYLLAKSMVARGVPIDGVGLQFHWQLGSHVPLSEVKQNMARYHDLGLLVHITELDIKCTPEGSGRPCTPDLLNAQAALYAGILRVCLEAPNCKSFETWGFYDPASWIGESEHPLLFSRGYVPKPAVDALVNLLLNYTA